jgi:hypothetical protein
MMMNERSFLYAVVLTRPQRRETPAVIAQKVLDTLDALNRIDVLFADWKVLDLLARVSLPLAVARARFATIIENNVVRDDYDQPERPRASQSSQPTPGRCFAKARSCLRLETRSLRPTRRSSTMRSFARFDRHHDDLATGLVVRLRLPDGLLESADRSWGAGDSL